MEIVYYGVERLPDGTSEITMFDGDSRKVRNALKKWIAESPATRSGYSEKFCE